MGYDALGRLTSDAQPYGTVAYEYDLAGRRTKMTWPGSFYVTYGYDTAGNLKTIKESGTTTIASFDYDSLGRRTTLTRGNGVATGYTFDAASRLTQIASVTAASSGDLTIGLAYNTAGQVKSRTSSNDAYSWLGAANVNRGYTANGLNQLTQSGGVSLGYDARGNLTSSGSDSYTYSAENLLTSATMTLPAVGTVTASLSYDPLLRLGQVSNTATAASRFVYDGGNIVAQATSSGTYNRRFVLVPGSDEIIAEYKPVAGVMNWKLTDERGSVISSAVDSTGTAGVPNSYDEYGIPAAGNAGRHQYTGQVWLGEVGLYYYKARLYSPTLGRFMQTDPIGYGDGLNWYNYVGSDPVNKSDPSGLVCFVGGGTKDYDEDGCNQVGGRYVRDPDIVINGNGSSSDSGLWWWSTYVVIPRLTQMSIFANASAAPQEGTPHNYVIGPLLSPCPASSVMNYLKQPGHSAPFAPAAQEGTHNVNLPGNNPISQYVNSPSGTIINTTIPPHMFYPGSVTIQVNALSPQTSTVTITGTGTGKDPGLNDFIGEGFFGGQAAGASDACGR